MSSGLVITIYERSYESETLPQLLEIFYNSIGRNSSMLIKFSSRYAGDWFPWKKMKQQSWLWEEKSRQTCCELGGFIAVISASIQRKNGLQVEIFYWMGNYETYWNYGRWWYFQPSVELDFGKENSISIGSYLRKHPTGTAPKKAFSLDKGKVNGNWGKKLFEGTTSEY